MCVCAIYSGCVFERVVPTEEMDRGSNGTNCGRPEKLKRRKEKPSDEEPKERSEAEVNVALRETLLLLVLH